MTTQRDPNAGADRLIAAFLAEGQAELPDRVYDEVRAEVDHTNQRSFIGPWRTLLVNRFATVAAVAVVVVIAVIVGLRLGGGGPLIGGNPSATPTPAGPTPESPASEPTLSIPADGSLPEGPFTLWDAPGDVAITVTIPGPGFFGEEGGGMLVKNEADQANGVALYVFQGPLYVYGDACHWSTTTPDVPATTADEIQAALEAQASRDGGSTGEFWRIGRGGQGRGVNLTVPVDEVFGDCDGGQFRSWVSDPLLDTNARILQGPGQVDELWVGAVNGVAMVFDVAYFAGTSRDLVDEMWSAVDQLATTYEMP